MLEQFSVRHEHQLLREHDRCGERAGSMKRPGFGRAACLRGRSAAVTMAPNVHRSCMTNDLALKYLATAGELAGVNRFYARRVLQRCKRGEITLLGAAQLLMAAANRAGTGIEVVAVDTSKTSTSSRVFRS